MNLACNIWRMDAAHLLIELPRSSTAKDATVPLAFINLTNSWLITISLWSCLPAIAVTKQWLNPRAVVRSDACVKITSSRSVVVSLKILPRVGRNCFMALPEYQLDTGSNSEIVEGSAPKRAIPITSRPNRHQEMAVATENALGLFPRLKL